MSIPDALEVFIPKKGILVSIEAQSRTMGLIFWRFNNQIGQDSLFIKREVKQLTF